MKLAEMNIPNRRFRILKADPNGVDVDVSLGYLPLGHKRRKWETFHIFLTWDEVAKLTALAKERPTP